MVAFDEIFGSTLARVIPPVKPVRSMVSEALLLPAAHSPAVAPEDALPFAAMIASRKVQRPSLPVATSELLLTVMTMFGAAVSAKLIFAGQSEKQISAAERTQIVTNHISRVNEGRGGGCKFYSLKETLES